MHSFVLMFEYFLRLVRDLPISQCSSIIHQKKGYAS